MTVFHTHHDDDGGRSGDRLRVAIGMAVILFAGLAAGILLSVHFGDRAQGYETRAAAYLQDNAAGSTIVDETVEAEAMPTSATTLAHDTTQAGPICEEFTKLVTIGGENQTIYGTACRQPDGTWDVQ